MKFTQEITWIESDEKLLNMQVEFIPEIGTDIEIEEIEIESLFIDLSGDDIYPIELDIDEIPYSDLEEIQEKVLKTIDHDEIIKKCHEDMELSRVGL